MSRLSNHISGSQEGRLNGCSSFFLLDQVKESDTYEHRILGNCTSSRRHLMAQH